MISGVSQFLLNRHGTHCKPGAKLECPFCGHRTFSIKRDDTVGKCFHPLCGKFILPEGNDGGQVSVIQEPLRTVLADFHTALLDQQTLKDRCGYTYLVEERSIHPQVVADSMLGVIPEGYDLDSVFSTAVHEEREDEELKLVAEAKEKLRRCVEGHSGWLCFFYTDQYHRILAIRFRQPYSKNIRYFKPFEAAGLFGLGMFKPDSRPGDTSLNGQLLATEGEFNQLQLQSLLVRYCEATGESWDYVNACAVGGVNNADFHTLAKVAAKPIICYDNDGSGAGFNLVEKARDIASVSAFTTPEVDSDLDDFIRSFGNRYTEAWKAVKGLISARVAYPKRYESVAAEVFHTRQKKHQYDCRRDFEINSKAAEIIRDDLQERGRFYWDAQGAYFFHEADKKLIRLERDQPECALLLDNYRINRTERIYRYVTENLWLTARKCGTRTDVYRLAYYDRERPAVHLYNHNNQIYRVGVDSVDLVDNGSDGVMFLSDSRAEPFRMGKPASKTSLLDRIIFSRIPFAQDILTPDERRLVLSLWFYSLFFDSIMPTKPILAFVGQKGSGKSSTLRKIGMLLFGSGFDVMPLSNKIDDFDAAVTNSAFVAIDNADSRVKWLEDRLATVATGGTIKRRQLYTTNQMVEIPVRCSLAITSRTPHFRRDDVADRLLIMKVDRLKSFASEESLVRELLQNRDAIMTEVVYQLQDVVRGLQASAGRDDSGAFRMADFGGFAIKVARASGVENCVRAIFHRITHEQSAFTLEGDPLFDLLSEWAEENSHRKVTNAELCQELSDLAEKKGASFRYCARERAFAQKMARLRPNLEQFFVIEEEQGRSRSCRFQFKPKMKEAK